MEECFDSVNVRDYQMTVVPIKNGHRATVSKSTVNSTRFMVVILSAGILDQDLVHVLVDSQQRTVCHANT